MSTSVTVGNFTIDIHVDNCITVHSGDIEIYLDNTTGEQIIDIQKQEELD